MSVTQWTDPILQDDIDEVKAVHVTELRNAVNILELNADNLGNTFTYVTGSDNAYVISSTTMTSYITGKPIFFKANHTNTGAATLQLNSLAAKPIRKLGSLDLAPQDIMSGEVIGVVFDGTIFQMFSATITDSGGTSKLYYNVNTGNAIRVIMSEVTSYYQGLTVNFKSELANTGVTTFEINTIGPVPLLNHNYEQLSGGEIVVDTEYQVVFNGTSFILQNTIYGEGVAPVYGDATGSANAITLTISFVSAYVKGLMVSFKVLTTNTGPVTLNVNSMGAKSIYKNYNNEIEAGDFVAGQVHTVIYDGAAFQLLSAINKPIDYFVEVDPGGLTGGSGSLVTDTAAWTGQCKQVIQPATGMTTVQLGYKDITALRGYHYSAGFRLRLNNTTAVDTLVTLKISKYNGTDYTLIRSTPIVGTDVLNTTDYQVFVVNFNHTTATDNKLRFEVEVAAYASLEVRLDSFIVSPIHGALYMK